MTGLRRLPARLFSNDFLLEVSVMAIDRWNRLSPDEQLRFRELAGRSGQPSSAPLSAREVKELSKLWKRIGARSLVREAISLATGRRDTPAGAAADSGSE